MLGLIIKITNGAVRLLRKKNENADAFSLKVGNAAAVLLPHRSVSYSHNARSMHVNESYSFRWKRIKKLISIDPAREPNPHILITGMSGFGKSTLFKSMLLDINAHNIPAIIFDAHNEHASIVDHLKGKVYNAEYTGINILELDGASVAERISELTRLFKNVYSLGYIQATKLSECLWYTYRKLGARSKSDRSIPKSPTMGDLVAELNIFIANARTVSERNTLEHLRGRISLLNTKAFGNQSLKISDLKSGIHLFSLAGMRSAEAQLIYISELLSRLYAQMKGNEKESGIKCYVMIDEAQFLIAESSGSNAIIGKLIEEGRKYGFGVLIVSHASSTLNRQIVANASTFITFYAREPNEVAYASKVLSGGDNGRAEAIRSRIRSLRQSEAIMISGHMRDPVLVSTPRYDALPRLRELPNEQQDITVAKYPISAADVPSLFSQSQLNRLMSENRLDKFTIKTNDSEETFYMQRKRSLSIEHEVCVGKISAYLTLHGTDNRIIDNSHGPDIVAFRHGLRYAIEYETGKKSLQDTINMLESRFNRYDGVVVVVNDKFLDAYKQGISNPRIKVLGFSELKELRSAF